MQTHAVRNFIFFYLIAAVFLLYCQASQAGEPENIDYGDYDPRPYEAIEREMERSDHLIKFLDIKLMIHSALEKQELDGINEACIEAEKIGLTLQEIRTLVVWPFLNDENQDIGFNNFFSKIQKYFNNRFKQQLRKR